MRVLVTGATGFVGYPLTRILVEQGHEVRALVRNPGKAAQLPEGVEALQGDVLEPATVSSALACCDACVHLVGILREDPDRGVTFDRLHYQATRNVVEACRQNEVRRLLHMSANGAERGLDTAYFASKSRAEAFVQASGLETVVMRPSLIYGGREGRPNFVGMIQQNLRWAPAFPYFGDGNYRLAPVSAREVGLAFASALVRPECPGKTYHLCGSECYSYKELLRLVRDLGGYRSVLFSVPFWMAEMPASWFGRQTWFPLTVEMLRMLRAGNVCPAGEPDFHGLLDVPTESFQQWLLAGRGGRPRHGPPPAPPLDRARVTGPLPPREN
ncbi:MAG: NAD(P)H-binding protein [Candidatus Eremiobacterota bacterium]